ncbi:hypothetical protein I350_00148 [Cryptococcus amylolentus CBS 6273]|nr:hypothetical protein I350_00148 [Cryptococcus amylolentus CBS 6273]
MIRSNPTAIPLRASDLKILQVEIDKRKAEREEQEAAGANPQRTTREGERRREEGGERSENGKSREQERRERHERIGLIMNAAHKHSVNCLGLDWTQADAQVKMTPSHVQ